jgi:hypothetical protein
MGNTTSKRIGQAILFSFVRKLALAIGGYKTFYPKYAHPFVTCMRMVICCGKGDYPDSSFFFLNCNPH